MSLINLKTILYKTISRVHEYETYDSRAPEDAKYPYVVYKLYPIVSNEKDKDFFNLEVSVWDKSASTSHKRVAEIADRVWKSLKGLRYIDANILVYSSRPSVGYIPDPDAEIKRYDVTCTLSVYRRDQ